MHGGGRRFKPCQLHKRFERFFLLFEIVSFCSFNKNKTSILIKTNFPIIIYFIIENLSNKNTLIYCSRLCKLKGFNQVNKGVRRMPWHLKAMKDVVSCDKLRLGANNRLTGDLRMGQPNQSNI